MKKDSQREEAKHAMKKLTAEQRDRLRGIVKIATASRNGEATEADVMRHIMDLPKEDVRPFTDILQAIGQQE